MEKTMKEIWKDIEGFEGKYQISTYGRVKSLVNNQGKPRELIRKPRKAKNGYLYLNLLKDGIPYCRKIHRLVAETFIENNKDMPAVNHKDGNKQNNNVENLEWVTYRENTEHAIRTKLFKPKYFEKGSQNPMFGKYFGDSPHAIKVYQFDLKGGLIRTWDCIKQAERELHIGHISAACKGKRNTAGGYVWKYETT